MPTLSCSQFQRKARSAKLGPAARDVGARCKAEEDGKDEAAVLLAAGVRSPKTRISVIAQIVKNLHYVLVCGA